MADVAIIHFSPIELYPPAQNLLRYLAMRNDNCSVLVLTTRNAVAELKSLNVDSTKIKIVSLGVSAYGKGRLRRIVQYLQFYILSIAWLLIQRPRTVLYFETLSSFPAFVYKTFIRRNVKLLIHYHEYTTPEEYENSMVLSKWFHRLEMKLYRRAAWISHTNDDRKKFFLKDISPVNPPQVRALPNFPPQSWKSEPKTKIGRPLKIVYAGALSLSTEYTAEFADWVLRQNGNVLWDIYSYNVDEQARVFIEKIENSAIRFFGGVNYDELPSLLRNYDVGVILYKGHIANYVYNAPNKLFEYLACGLDVWAPDQMKGVTRYLTNGYYPRVMAFDFTNLRALRIDDVTNRDGLLKTTHGYFCEDVLDNLVLELGCGVADE